MTKIMPPENSGNEKRECGRVFVLKELVKDRNRRITGLNKINRIWEILSSFYN